MRFFARITLLALIIGIGCTAYIKTYDTSDELKVSFFDIGQGDATFVETSEGVQILIDGGPDGGVLRDLQQEMGFFDRDIDIVVATHFDQDHIGGLIDVLARYEVSLVLITDNKTDTASAGAFFTAIEHEGAKVLYAHAGQSIALLGGVTLSVLSPDRSVRDVESNAASIVLKLVYGETEFLLTGDAPSAVERRLVRQYGSALRSDVLKVGHHGSQTSSDSTFVAAVDPVYAIISAGKDNRYGHPHDKVLDTLDSFGIEIKNTADEGSIRFMSNGEQIFLE